MHETLTVAEKPLTILLPEVLVPETAAFTLVGDLPQGGGITIQRIMTDQMVVNIPDPKSVGELALSISGKNRDGVAITFTLLLRYDPITSIWKSITTSIAQPWVA